MTLPQDDGKVVTVAQDYLDELPTSPPPTFEPDSQQKVLNSDDDFPLYVCNCSYTPDSKDELSLETGQKYHIVEKNEDGKS